MHSHDTVTPSTATKLEPGDLVSERDAAKLLGIAIQTLRNWRWRGAGPRVHKIGQRLVRYHRADLQAFIEAGNASKGVAK